MCFHVIGLKLDDSIISSRGLQKSYGGLALSFLVALLCTVGDVKGWWKRNLARLVEGLSIGLYLVLAHGLADLMGSTKF